jgi:hypothetical protein
VVVTVPAAAAATIQVAAVTMPAVEAVAIAGDLQVLTHPNGQPRGQRSPLR